MVAPILLISCQTDGELVLYMNSLSNKYTITKYLTSSLFAIIKYLLLLFVLVIDRLTTTQNKCLKEHH